MLPDFEPKPIVVRDNPAGDRMFGSTINRVLGGLSIGFILFGWFIDWLSKYYFSRAQYDGVLWPGFLSLTDHKNYGLIGNFPLPKYIIVLLMLTALALVGKALLSVWRQNQWAGVIGLSLILAGALGNLTDRLVHGYVFDWILLFNTSVINLADIMITAGIIIYIYSQIKSGVLTENKK